MALEGDSAFWTTPPNAAPQGLSLERWAMDGSRTHTIRREAAWLPEKGYGERTSADEPALPEYDMLHRMPDGLLWVTVIVRDPRWQQVTAEEAHAMERELFDARVEVIDPYSGTVVASYTYDGPPDTIPPFALFLPGTRRSYRMINDSTTGLSRLEIFDIYLAKKQ